MFLKRCIIIVFASMLFLMPLFGCVPQATPVEKDETGLDAVSAATQARYTEREIRGYEGTRLDPAVGPRDNSINGVQSVNLTSYSLKITGLVNKEQELEYKKVLEFDAYERLITLYCVEGWDATILWEGVRIVDLIDAAGADASANTVIFKAVDGYTTSIPIDEIKAKDMLLAYKSNGVDLPPQMGFPFIVLAEDKLGYKWCRWVTEIELTDDENYKGYWESRGYSNEADIK